MTNELPDELEFMLYKPWNQYHVLEVLEKMQKIPDKERESAAALLAEAAGDPRTAIKILDQLIARSAKDRRELYRLHQSDEPELRSLALSRSVSLPPSPPVLLADLDAAIKWTKLAVKRRNDDRTSRLQAIYDELRAIRREVQKQYDQLKREEENHVVSGRDPS